MNKRRRREKIAEKQAEARTTVKLFFFRSSTGEEIGGLVLDQAATQRQPERIAHAEIDPETVRRLRGNTETPGRGGQTAHLPEPPWGDK